MILNSTISLTKAFALIQRGAVPPDPPACSSCLGKWTGDFMSSFGGSSATLSGPCNHRQSATMAQVNSGLFGASIQMSSAFTIDWPSTELRVMGMRTYIAQTIADSSHQINTPILSIVDLSVDLSVGAIVSAGGYSPSSGETCNLVNIQGSADGDVATNTNHLMIGIRGDGKAYALTPLGFTAKDTALDTGHTYALACAGSTGWIGYYTSGYDAEVLTDAVGISALFALPDMSAEGITEIKDFCGNML